MMFTLSQSTHFAIFYWLRKKDTFFSLLLLEKTILQSSEIWIVEFKSQGNMKPQ